MADKSQNPEGQDEESAQTKSQDAIALLKADHRKVEQLFDSYEKANDNAQKRKIAKEVCTELIIHTIIEEEIFYPACREKIGDQKMNEAQVEHDGAKVMIMELLAGSPDKDEYYDAKLKVLAEEIKHHVHEEEKRSEGIFAKAKEAGVETAELSQRLTARKQELKARADEDELGKPTIRSLRAYTERKTSQQQEDRKMARRSSTPDRDEYGRFTSDDDDRYSGGYSRSRDHDDDDYRSRGGSRSASMRRRDEEGRFMSDEDYGRRSSRNRGSRYDDDDDDNYGSGRSRSASMRDRDEYGRFVSDDDYGDRRSRYEDDGERYSSRSGRGHGGWFGDSEGHSEAARRGRDERSGERNGSRYSDDDDRYRRSSSRASGRSRYEDEDERSSRSGRGHGGWFGDSEGHSEAARRGWDRR